MMASSSSSSSSSSTRDPSELRRVFRMFDRNGDGRITRKELGDSLRNLGIFIPDDDLAAMIAKIDANGDGCVDMAEFGALYDSIMADNESNKNTKNINNNGDGDDDDDDDDGKEKGRRRRRTCGRRSRCSTRTGRVHHGGRAAVGAGVAGAEAGPHRRGLPPDDPPGRQGRRRPRRLRRVQADDARRRFRRPRHRHRRR
uniref:EF-hand domain-containing protein n=1 Tax=Ananas comosus var. bracteatus TaxID=296719 RepID=A0A6V7Q1F3_ANACO|nr:unnamed protein product [Ananas comosus var. bracteatus]